MKTITFFIITFSSYICLSQDSIILNLENQKKELLIMIETLHDSIKKIENEINYLKAKEVQKMINDSTLFATARKGSKIRKNSDVFSEIITVLPTDQEVIIVDYIDGYFGICSDSVCGYMSELWINKNDKINQFVNVKLEEKKRLEQLEREQKLKEQKVEWEKLEKKYINKYGLETYTKLKQGYYWIGMSKEMATISLGPPKSVNRTVGSWGIHEQWVYQDLYLYFENGILKSFQD